MRALLLIVVLGVQALGCSDSNEDAPAGTGGGGTGGGGSGTGGSGAFGGSGATDGGTTLPTPTIEAKSCEEADVQAAVDSAGDGDVVGIPAGTCTWTSQVAVGPKAIVLMGAGMDATRIVDDIDKSGGLSTTVALIVDLALGKKFRLTSLTFEGKAQDVDVYNKGTVHLGGTSHDFRVDHVKFDRPGTSALRYSGDLWGVVDHNVFDLSSGSQGNVVYHDAWNGGEHGDGSFAEPLALGTEKAIYIEDNTFLGTGVAGKGVVDALGGGRFVFRHNQVTEDNMATHGTESGGRFRSVRSYEIYENTFTTETVLFTGLYLRGGTGVIFSNTFTGYKDAVLGANYRSDQAYAPWGLCDGANPYDGNQEANGYPCIDQVGWGQSDLLSGDPPPAAWPNQSAEPVYVWDITWNPVPDYPGSLAASQSEVIEVGRDILVGTPMPGYTPYTYPHPLTLE